MPAFRLIAAKLEASFLHHTPQEHCILTFISTASPRQWQGRDCEVVVSRQDERLGSNPGNGSPYAMHPDWLTIQGMEVGYQSAHSAHSMCKFIIAYPGG